MGLDIRKPIGWLFICLGSLLFGYGLAMGPAAYQKSLGIDVDFTWGIVLFLGGVLSLLLSRLSCSARGNPKKN
jgi:hypothetical protein